MPTRAQMWQAPVQLCARTGALQLQGPVLASGADVYGACEFDVASIRHAASCV